MQSIDPDAMSSGKPVNAESLQSVLLTGDFIDMMRRKVHSRENPVCMKSATQGMPGESTVSYTRDRLERPAGLMHSVF